MKTPKTTNRHASRQAWDGKSGMTNIVILGAGVMGSALASVAAARNNVTLVGSPLDKDIISSLKSSGPHPGLRLDLPESITAIDANELNDETMKRADVIVIGVSSPGVEWALKLIEHHHASPDILALVTKGLVSTENEQSAPRTYAQSIGAELTTPSGSIVGIGGPCIARELAAGYPTRVCFASKNIAVANKLRELLSTDYYSIATHTDFTGLEACAALKNFMCIGVSTMFTAHRLDDSNAKNPLAALFNQAVLEISLLSRWIKANNNSASADSNAHANTVGQDLAFDLAGMGDLHVTVGGGRNSMLGQHLGRGRHLKDILATDMHNVTVEGVDTGRQLLPGFRYACEHGTLKVDDFPVTCAILDVIENDRPFAFEFDSLPG